MLIRFYDGHRRRRAGAFMSVRWFGSQFTSSIHVTLAENSSMSIYVLLVIVHVNYIIYHDIIIYYVDFYSGVLLFHDYQAIDSRFVS